jgi:DNA topoisomerase III
VAGRSGGAAAPGALTVVPDWEEGAAAAEWDEDADIGVRRGRGRRSGPGAFEPRPSPALVEALKAWRLAEAKRRRIPAFRILTDRVLGAIAAMRPVDNEALLSIQGVGPKLVERYGSQLLALVGRGR